MKVALTPASSPGSGGGHLLRCLALARALAAKGAAPDFIVSSTGARVLERFGWSGGVKEVHGEADRLKAIDAFGPDAVVVDDYSLDARFEGATKRPVLAIDDLADRPHACTLLLDSAYGRTEEDYARIAPGARLLLGPAYALLREGFTGPARRARQRVGRVFIAFGLSDVEGITARATRLLRPLLPDAHFDVALSSDAPSLEPLRAMSERSKGLTLHIDADVAPLMRAADLGVGAGGGMVWERRAAGLPQLVVTLADNQRPMAERLEAAGVILRVDLQDPAFELRLAEAFGHLVSPAARRAQVDNPDARCDGGGAARAAEALMDAVSRTRAV